MERNRALLDSAKESFKRRQNIRIAKNIKLKFPKASPEELASIKAFMELKAQKRDRQAKIAFVTILSVSMLALIIFWLLGAFEPKGPHFQKLSTDGKKRIASATNQLVTSFQPHVPS